ncbi:MAG: hypothetical protein N4A49_01250, partial [Marinifilaceae bacterium]|nr:hypothetical protein [Marinifilaceae bacterium]
MLRICRSLILLLFLFNYVCANSQIIVPRADTTICEGAKVKLVAKPGSYMYNWDNGMLSKEIIVQPNKTTTYTLDVYIPRREIELINNGNFQNGRTGFTSEYTYCPNTYTSNLTPHPYNSLYKEGVYAIGTNANAYHSHFTNCNGYSGSYYDKMLIVNGSARSGVVVWSQKIKVQPYTFYAFSAQACNVIGSNPAYLEFRIDGVLMNDFIDLSGRPTCEWHEFYSLWNSSAKTDIEISIINRNTVSSGNDYALDNISFNPLEQITYSLNVFVQGEVNFGDKSILCKDSIVELDAGELGHSFLWSTGETSRKIKVDMPGNYSVKLTLENGCVQNGNIKIDLDNFDFKLLADKTTCIGETVKLKTDLSSTDDITALWNDGSDEFEKDVISSGKYSLQLTNKNGCVQRDTMDIEFFAKPVFDLGADQTHCLKSGESVELIAPLDDCTYLWNTGETTKSISISKSGKYLLELTNKLGCTYKDSLNIIINEIPVFDLGADQTHCLKSGETVELVAPLDDCTYLWNTGESTKSISISKSGKYLLELTNKLGCTYKDSV